MTFFRNISGILNEILMNGVKTALKRERRKHGLRPQPVKNESRA